MRQAIAVAIIGKLSSGEVTNMGRRWKTFSLVRGAFFRRVRIVFVFSSFILFVHGLPPRVSSSWDDVNSVCDIPSY